MTTDNNAVSRASIPAGTLRSTHRAGNNRAFSVSYQKHPYNNDSARE